MTGPARAPRRRTTPAGVGAPVLVPVPVLVLVLALVLAGCGGDPAPPEGGPSVRTTPTSTPSTAPGATAITAPGATATPSAPGPTDVALPPVRDQVSLPALMRERLPGGRLRVGRQVRTDRAYTRSEVTYPSSGATVSGVLLRPRGRGPFPAVVLAHGYIEPSVYVTGQGLVREQDYLARAGFVVLHTDYRGHAGSSAATEPGRETRLDYTRDVITAVRALKRAPYVDPRRVALLGRSMGGGVALNALVTEPGLVRAAVVFAPVSSSFLDNLRRWTLPERPEAARRLYARFGTPRQDPAFYRDLSARTFFGRITEPVLIHHGTADDTCPIGWSRTTQRLLRRAGVDSRLEVYRGEQHAFVPQWPTSMERTVRFLRRQMQG